MTPQKVGQDDHHVATVGCQFVQIKFAFSLQVGVVVGGISPSISYIAENEAFSPKDASCHGKAVAPFPNPLMGTVSGMVGGVGLVCGGAAEDYGNCTNNKDGETGKGAAWQAE